MQPHGVQPVAAPPGYPAPPSLPPQQQGSSTGPPFPGQLAIPGPPPGSYFTQASGQAHLLPQPEWKQDSIIQQEVFEHANYAILPHSTMRADVKLLQLI